MWRPRRTLEGTTGHGRVVELRTMGPSAAADPTAVGVPTTEFAVVPATAAVPAAVAISAVGAAAGAPHHRWSNLLHQAGQHLLQSPLHLVHHRHRHHCRPQGRLHHRHLLHRRHPPSIAEGLGTRGCLEGAGRVGVQGGAVLALTGEVALSLAEPGAELYRASLRIETKVAGVHTGG
ncbi:unnamed protein product [Closterium sp. NIES-53]